MVDTIKLKFQNRITSKDKSFIQSTIHKLIHLEKTNLVQHKNFKKSIRTRQIEVGGKIKQLRSDTKSIQRPKSIIVSTLPPISNIPTTSDDAYDPNQACLIVTGPSFYKAVDICLSICKKENMQDSVRLNVLCISTDTYDKNQANNMFY